MLDLLPDDKQETMLAIQLTDIRLSPNDDYTKRWWERNKDRPRCCLKQGIGQDLHLLGKFATNGVEFARALERGRVSVRWSSGIGLLGKWW